MPFEQRFHQKGSDSEKRLARGQKGDMMDGRCALLVLAIAARHGFALDPNRRLSQYGHNAWRLQDGFLPGPVRQIGLAQTGDGS